jgi:maltose alpha-D-glucosyltransferase / alpha-amylase
MPRRTGLLYLPDDNPFWYKDAVIYELHVRAFHDSDDDGVGDFRGLTGKLDYLQDLGITAVWLLPFYPSPLKDDGYDTEDYTNVHPAYGTLADFRAFLREAHRRGIRVITELVLNHTSDRHPWFQRARRSPPGSKWRDFYVWSGTPDKYREARVIFKDFETSNWSWDPVAGAYYWHRFYSHQPDLNYDSPEVRRAVLNVLRFWLGMGVDGLRLDAVPYLYEREGTSCENLPETHRALKMIRRRIDERFRNRMLLAEANQWPEDAIHYFGEGDECHMAFHFPLMPRMFMAVRMESRYPIIDILMQTPPIPEPCQWALFLRNHDELTLEMVTDEERDYMYRVYAHDPQMRINFGIRRRLYPLLGKDRPQYELMNALLFSLPGTPVIYYGDEIGMGDNIYIGDRNGVRTPMQWNADRNAGFSRAPSQRLYLPVIIDPDYHYETFNVEARQNNPNSILWYMKRLIALRKRHKAFGRGTIEFLYPENHRVFAFVRRHEDEIILVVANLSRFSQFAELDLSSYKGRTPVEMFGLAEFPPVREQPYVITLGPHAFYWFSLDPAPPPAGEIAPAPPESRIPLLRVERIHEPLFRKEVKEGIERVLPEFLRARRWFGGKARRIKSVDVAEAVHLHGVSPTTYVALLQVVYTEGDPESYSLPLAFAGGERAAAVLAESPQAVVARLAVRQRGEEREAIVYDALAEKNVCAYLLESVAHRRRFKGSAGEIACTPSRPFRRLRGPAAETPLAPSPVRAEQSNTSVVFGDRLILKAFRRLDEGVNPDLEIGLYLTEKAGFPHTSPVAGAIEYRRRHKEPITLAILQGFVPNQGDAWQFTLENLGRFFERTLASPVDPAEAPCPRKSPLSLADDMIPPLAADLIGTYIPAAALLGQRTADLHVALASNVEDPSLAPEGFSPHYQRSLYQSMRNLTAQVLILLRKKLRALPEEVREESRRILDLEGEILKRFRSVLDRKITAMRIRVHGDYHLGQVLYTGKDFVIIDFEGEPAHSLTARRIKRSPLRDVAGMLRSFDYASSAHLIGRIGGSRVRPEDVAALEPWARCWVLWVSSRFLKAYLEGAARGPFLPRTREELSVLLNVYLLEKAVYELGYELNHRPDWVRIPVRGILHFLETWE